MTELTHKDLQELEDSIETRLEEWSIETHKQEPRTHLGISEIGEDCRRKLYYKFRWFEFEKHSGRMLRLFARGHREEEKYINYLEGIGWKIFRCDPTTGKQFRVSGVLGHYGGSCDGVGIPPDGLLPINGIPFVCEFKTHNTKSFTYYVDKGLQIAKPKHYDQSCGYGEKLQIQYGLYFPENKNDDDIKVTAFKLDWNRAKELEKKATEIILATEPPPRISESPAFFDCKMCFARDICHNKAIPQKNCRTCKLSTPTENATWTCAKFGIIPPDFIKTGCPQWMPI